MPQKLKNWEIIKAFEEGEIIKSTTKTNGGKVLFNIKEFPRATFNFTENLYEVIKEPKINWPKIPVDTPILVKDDEDSDWSLRYFSSFDGEKVHAFADGKKESDNWSILSWDRAKLDLNAKSTIHWLPNTGVEPEGNWVAELSNGDIYSHVMTWDLNVSNPVVRYFLI